MKKIPQKTSTPNTHTAPQKLEYEPLREHYFRSSDLNFVSYLKSRYGLKVIEVSRDAMGRIQWTVNVGDLNPHELFNDYIGGGQVSCAAFVAELRNLKTQIRNMA